MPQQRQRVTSGCRRSLNSSIFYKVLTFYGSVCQAKGAFPGASGIFGLRGRPPVAGDLEVPEPLGLNAQELTPLHPNIPRVLSTCVSLFTVTERGNSRFLAGVFRNDF